MKKFVCTVCGYVYDEAAGIPANGISPGTKWEDVPDAWACPLCGATKAEFQEQASDGKPAEKKENAAREIHEDDMRELSFGELSALCSNLSKGCEKQYRPEEAGLFAQLAEYYESKSKPSESKQMDDLSALVRKDLEDSYPGAGSISAAHSDRGALRALVWSEKVTRILASLLSRYEKQKDALLENTNVYVCEICGFVYLGDEPPEICPVCKVPNMKIRKIEKEAI